jgi:hypothetical protein
MTQGIQGRETLPEWFVKWADSKLGEPLDCIVWDNAEPNIVHLDSETKTARIDLTGTRLAA